MTTLALQMVEEIRTEVAIKVAENRLRDSSFHIGFESTTFDGQCVPPGDKYNGHEYATVEPDDESNLARLNCPAFVVPRHFRQ